MLETVVENQQLALAPVSRFGADAQPATVGHDQRQVTDEPRVEHAVVRLEMGDGGEAREERDRGATGDEGRRRQHQRGARAESGSAPGREGGCAEGEKAEVARYV